MLSNQCVQWFKSYHSDKLFQTKQEDENSVLIEITAGVPQGIVLGSTLYLVHIKDISEIQHTTLVVCLMTLHS